MADPFDEIADRLYAVPPTEFTRRRDEEITRARTDKDRALVARLRALRRPSQGAWLVNLLVHEKPGVVEMLQTVGAQLRAAQSELRGDTLRELSARRQQVVTELRKQATTLAASGGQRVAEDAAAEAAETLLAALADPDAAAEVATGRLVRPISYTGFGPALISVPRSSGTSKAGQGSRHGSASDGDTARRSGSAGARTGSDRIGPAAVPRAAQREALRREAELAAAERAEAQRVEVERADQRLVDAEAAVDRAERFRGEIALRTADLARQLREVEAELRAAEEAVAAAARDRQQAASHRAALKR